MARQTYAKWRSGEERKKGIYFLSVAAIIAVLFVYVFSNVMVLGLAVVFALVSFHFFGRSNIWHLGSVGERIVADHLKGIGKGYSVLNDVRIPGAWGNIDHIVFGRNGIFALETKNHNGRIECNGDEWVQIKGVHRKYAGSLRNPSKQAKGNAYSLRKFIEQNRKEIFSHSRPLWVNAILVFTNEEADLHLHKPTVPVLRPEELCDFIRSQGSCNTMSFDEMNRLEKLLGNYPGLG